MYVNTAETLDGADTDGNGFVDDVHGIAFDLDDKDSADLLHIGSPIVFPEPEKQANKGHHNFGETKDQCYCYRSCGIYEIGLQQHND